MSVLDNLGKIVMDLLKGKIEPLLLNHNTSPSQHILQILPTSPVSPQNINGILFNKSSSQ